MHQRGGHEPPRRYVAVAVKGVVVKDVVVKGVVVKGVVVKGTCISFAATAS